MEAISAKTIYAFGRQLIINEPLDEVEWRSLDQRQSQFRGQRRRSLSANGDILEVAAPPFRSTEGEVQYLLA